MALSAQTTAWLMTDCLASLIERLRDGDKLGWRKGATRSVEIAHKQIEECKHYHWWFMQRQSDISGRGRDAVAAMFLIDRQALSMCEPAEDDTGERIEHWVRLFRDCYQRHGATLEWSLAQLEAYYGRVPKKAASGPPPYLGLEFDHR